MNGILACMLLVKPKAINGAIQMPVALLLIPSHQVIQAFQTQLDRDDLMLLAWITLPEQIYNDISEFSV